VLNRCAKICELNVGKCFLRLDIASSIRAVLTRMTFALAEEKLVCLCYWIDLHDHHDMSVNTMVLFH